MVPQSFTLTKKPANGTDQKLHNLIKDLSKRQLTTDEDELLQKGLNSNIAPKRLDMKAPIPCVELALQSLRSIEANKLRK